MQFGSSFCYDRDYEEDYGPTDWDLERSWYYSRFSDQQEEVELDPHEADDDLQDVLSAPTVRDWDYESGRGRHRSKGATLRSWRRPHSLGGSHSRKGILKKMQLRHSDLPAHGWLLGST